ncbi:MAG: outer membrane beta-barrel protein [Niabella sp.]
MKHLFLIVVSFLLSGAIIKAQTISGQVSGDDKTTLAKASVTLFKAQDSSLVKINVTNDGGAYIFKSVLPGTYFIAASMVGYSTANSTVFKVETNAVTVPELILHKITTQMQAVVVTARKPMVEVKADRMIVNVEGTINATGNDGIELLRRSPGVMVDKDDNISMAGKSGVQVYIDGKPSPLAGTDLANYLRSLQSSSIEAIELITNPSAKYEAAGNAGIINIKLKKDKSLGTNGTVNAGYNIGRLPKYNAGFSLNHRTKKLNIFGNYNYSDNRYHTLQSIYKEQNDSLFDQQGVMRMDRQSHNFKTGVDFFVNTKNTIGVMANGTLGKNATMNNSQMDIGYLPTGVIDRVLLSSVDANGKRNNVNFNANYRYADTSGRELNIDADYGIYRNNNNQYLPNITYNANKTVVLESDITRLISPSDIDLFAFKVDYEQKLGKGKLGLGGKVGYVTTKNDLQTYNVVSNVDYIDDEKSSQFNYTENINALYASYNRAFKGYAIQVGLRAENTVSEVHSFNTTTGYDSTLHRNYLDLFPSASVTFNKNPMSQLTFAYSRRIDRPSYENLNPFVFKLNKYLYMKGNTALQPQYTNSYSVTHVYKYKLTTKLDYSHVRDMFAQVLDTVGNSSESIQNTKNLATQDVVSLNISYPFMYKQFMMFSNLTSSYSKYKADYGNGRIIDLDNFNLQYFVQNTLKFGKKKDWTAELTGLYLSPFVWAGTFKGKAMGSVDVGLQKTIMKGRGTVKTSVTDIFKTMRFSGISNYSGAYNDVLFNWESRQFKLNFTYRFGSAQIKSARQRKTALEDEKSRTQGGGNTPGQ